MRKRQIKKFVRASKKNMDPYREAFAGTGSKKLSRRRKAFARHSQLGLGHWSAQQRMKRVTAELSRFVVSADDPQSIYTKLAGVVTEWSGFAKAELASITVEMTDGKKG